MALRDLFLLDPHVVFLNHGSFGACPKPVFAAYQDWQRELERQPVEFFARRYYDHLRKAREALGTYIGADAENLVYVPNATFGTNTVARSLALNAGDEVLATDQEYGASDSMWQVLCRKAGARYIRQPVTLPIASAEQFIEQMWAGVTPRTRVLFISHITSATAIIFPIAELLRRARERGIITLVDGAHAPGQIDLNLRELDPDFYSANNHKWLMAPKGSGFLYARPAAQALVEPLVYSSEWRLDPPASTRFLNWQEYQGTRDIAAFLSTEDAIEFLPRYHWDDVRRKCHALLRYCREQLTALTGLTAITPDDPAWYVQFASLPLPPINADALKRRLYDEYLVEVPIITWQDRYFVRVSIQGYNIQADVDTLVNALRILLPQVKL